MKLTLNISLKEILTALKLPQDTEIVITDMPDMFNMLNMFNSLKLARQIITEIEKLRYRQDEKIAAIKSIRTLVPGTGLIEAKFVIENFGRFMEFVEEHSRMPKIDVENNTLCLS